MEIAITLDDFIQRGLDAESAQALLTKIKAQVKIDITAEQSWKTISQELLAYHYDFSIHLFIFTALFPNWHQHPELAPAWMPDVETLATANLSTFMARHNFSNVQLFHQWSVHQFEIFWDQIIQTLQIEFKAPYTRICDLSKGVEHPEWLVDATINISDSCLKANPNAPAIIYKDDKNNPCTLSYSDLNNLVNRIANGLVALGYQPGDAIGIMMPMNFYAVAIYLAIIRMGATVVSIADSFSANEIYDRLTIANAKLIFTQDYNLWNGKRIPLYDKLNTRHGQAAVRQSPNIERPKAIVLSHTTNEKAKVLTNDIQWENFLSDNATFEAYACQPMDFINILFSSGTTAQPKAIPWSHATAIKAASDAYFHQNIQPGDVLAWPTNLGWMMGPWLIFAAFMNNATIALYNEVPKDRTFGEFIADAKVTMLGVVPTLVHTWRQSKCMEGLNWRNIKLFSSTGECSNPEDMLYLMSLAGYKPIIEYCGGTEIGGSYVSSTVLDNNCPSLFSTPVMGIDFAIIDEAGKIAETGEVAIIPPSLGLSTTVLNGNHHEIYYAGMPKYNDFLLRRHGDQIKQFSNGFYMLLGRADDAINLGGIKISSAEIERVIADVPEISEAVAVGITPPNHGPTLLVIFVVNHIDLDKHEVLKKMQQRINTHLNPLFKIHDVIFVDELPKTASNKIMRRRLRESYASDKTSSV